MEALTLKEWFESDAHKISEKIYKLNGRWAWTDYVSGLRGPDDEALHVYKAVFVALSEEGAETGSAQAIRSREF